MPVPQDLIDALRAAHGRGARLVSICSGAFVLARAGLLSGRRAVTHWKYLDALASLDSTIRIEADALYVDDGGVLTSAGSAAGLDLCVHIVRQDYGAAVANSVARRLVLPAHRQGRQSQFVPAPMGTGRGGVAPLLDRIRGQLDRPWSVERMADAASTSPRTLLRRFTESTGLSPKQWLLEQRLQRARDLLEGTRDSIEQVAAATGLRSPESLRHHFRRRYGVSPSAYRAAFGRPKPGTSARTGGVAQ
jgi:AraC family transcriptional activator FtrA